LNFGDIDINNIANKEDDLENGLGDDMDDEYYNDMPAWDE